MIWWLQCKCLRTDHVVSAQLKFFELWGSTSFYVFLAFSVSLCRMFVSCCLVLFLRTRTVLHVITSTWLRFKRFRTCRWLFTISASLRSAQFYKISTSFFSTFLPCYWLSFVFTLHISLCAWLRLCVRALLESATLIHLQIGRVVVSRKVVYGECICVKRFISLSFDVVTFRYSSACLFFFLSHHTNPNVCCCDVYIFRFVGM